DGSQFLPCVDTDGYSGAVAGGVGECFEDAFRACAVRFTFRVVFGSVANLTALEGGVNFVRACVRFGVTYYVFGSVANLTALEGGANFVRECGRFGVMHSDECASLASRA